MAAEVRNVVRVIRTSSPGGSFAASFIGRIARAKVRPRPLQQCQQHDKTTANRPARGAQRKASIFRRAGVPSPPQFAIRFVRFAASAIALRDNGRA